MRASLAIIVGAGLAACAADGPTETTPSVEIAAATANIAPPLGRRTRTKPTIVPMLRSERDIQVARNVTAIMRGMRAVQLEMHVDSCEEAEAAELKIEGCDQR